MSDWTAFAPPQWVIRSLGRSCRVATGDRDTIDAQREGDVPFYVRSAEVQRIDVASASGEAILTPGDGAVGEIFHHHKGGAYAAHQRVYVIDRFADDLLPRFFYWYFSATFGLLTRQGTAKSTVDSLRRPMFTSFPVLIPPLTGQRAIADYLDRETAKIDTLIEKQTTMIERLRERRAAVITRVAGFAEKRAAASPTDGWGGSSVSCVAKPMRSLLVQRVSDGPHETPVFQDSGVPFLSVDGIQNGELVFDSKTRFISRLDHLRYSRKARPQVGDVLMGKAASTGKIAEVKVTFEFNVWSPLAILRPRAEVSPSWLAYALKSASSQAQVDLLCTNNTQKNLAMADIPRIVLAVPTLEKQREIADYLDRETVKIDMLIAKVERHIELAKERRAALITAAVTGQIDVTTSTQSGDAA